MRPAAPGYRRSFAVSGTIADLAFERPNRRLESDTGGAFVHPRTVAAPRLCAIDGTVSRPFDTKFVLRGPEIRSMNKIEDAFPSSDFSFFFC